MVETISWPLDTIRLNPMPRSLNATAANADPECEMNVTGPARMSSGVANPVARKPVSRFRNPMPLPPHIAMPAERAIAPSRSGSAGTSAGGSSSNNDENVTAERAPAATASRNACSMRAFDTPRIARSTGSGSSAIDG